MHLPLAFSIHHFISSVGADAGFAAIIGLAILVLLYFAQARETTTLRDEAIAASQRVEQLERRVAQLRTPPIAPPPGAAANPAAGGQQATSGGQPVTGVPAAARPLASPAASVVKQRALVPAAPAGVGAPALFDATRLIPALAGPLAQTSEATVGGPPPDQGQQPAAPQPSQTGRQAAGATALATPPPATAAAGANGAGEQPPAPRPAANALPPRLQVRPDQPGLAGSLSPAGRSRRARWLPVLLGALLLAAVVAVLLILTSTGGSTQHASGAQSSNAPTSATGSKTSFTPASVTVAVLNGTDVSQLAHRVAQKLARAGYRQSTVATAADQTHASTIIAFLPGFRRDSTHVAAALSLPVGDIQQADQSARAIACPPPAACHVNVIVTVGSDLTNSR